MTGKRPLLSRIISRASWEARQALRLPGMLREAVWDTRFHDLKARLGAVTQTKGQHAAASSVAIYVIFPTRGLLDSHLLALRSIAGQGYAPVVVANAPLADAERERLLPLCWRLIERPNFGYDFGGYRAGVLSLGADLAKLDRLALLNDSIWFPLPVTPDWLAGAEALGVDFAGAVSNYGVTQVPLDRFEDAVWDYDPARPGFHYCSVALWFGTPVLRDPAFRRFWQGFRLTDNKFRTVRRGEVGLS